jgi:CheY-like chemotaxis protein
MPSSTLRILVIEDNAALARLFADMFGIMGCSTATALNADAGLDSAKTFVPDVVFCDLRLPGPKDGCDFARSLRAEPAFAHVPLIAITGSTDAADFERARWAGFDRVFAKPFKFREIQELMHGLKQRKEGAA